MRCSTIGMTKENPYNVLGFLGQLLLTDVSDWTAVENESNLALGIIS